MNPRPSVIILGTLVVSLLLVPGRPVAAQVPALQRVPLILDTDLGSGIDDAFALALALASPELEIVGITTCGKDAEDRAWMVCRFLSHGGFKNIPPIAFGRAPQPDYRGVPVDARHYALAAESEADLDLWRGRLRSAGVAFWEEGHGEQSSIYFPDPDGVIFEITFPPSRVSKAMNPTALAAVRRWTKGAVAA